MKTHTSMTAGRLAAVLAVLAAAAASAGAPALSAQSAAEGPGRVEGSVVEAESGDPISGATVLLEATAVPGGTGAPDRVAHTDDDGRYGFEGVDAGRYRLQVSGLGYRAATVWVELPLEWSLRRSFELAVEPIALEPLTVRPPGSRGPWSPGGVDGRLPAPGASPFGAGLERPTLDARVVLPSDVDERATLGEPDLFRALQRLPGISGRGDYSAELWTRGAPWGLTRILVDGLPVYDPLHLGGVATGLAAEALEGAFVLPGARPAALSEGAAGLVSLVTRRARGGLHGSASVSPVAARVRLEDRWVGDRLGVSVTARRSWWDMVDPPAGLAARGPGEAVDYHFADVAGRIDLRIDPAWMLEAGGLWEEDRIDGDVADLVSASDGRWGNRLGWVALGHRVGPSTTLRLFAGRSGYAVSTRPRPWASFYGPNGLPSLDKLEVDLARSVLRIEAGGRLGGEAVDWSAGVEHAREALSQLGADAVDRGVPGTDAPARTAWSRGWADGTLRVGALALSGGVSLDWTDEGARGLRPSVRARWQITDGVTVEAARSEHRQTAYPLAPAGRTVGPALRVGHVWVVAGEGRPALTSRVATLSVEARPTDGLTALVTAWRRRIDGLWMDGVSTVAGGRLEPASPEGSPGTEWGEGVELTLRGHGARITGEASYTYGRSRMVGGSGVPWASPADRRHSLDLLARGRVVGGLDVGGLFRLESGWPLAEGPWACGEDLTQEECGLEMELRPEEHAYRRAPTYASLDLLVDWLHRGERVSWGLSASLRNVLGRENAQVFRASSCNGAELLSVACESIVGPGRFAPGLTAPTPALSLRVLF